MSDVVDVANQAADEALARALANRIKSPTGISPVDCDECGEPIEPARRRVIPGTVHCSECAKYLEKRNQFNRGA